MDVRVAALFHGPGLPFREDRKGPSDAHRGRRPEAAARLDIGEGRAERALRPERLAGHSHYRTGPRARLTSIRAARSAALDWAVDSPRQGAATDHLRGAAKTSRALRERRSNGRY